MKLAADVLNGIGEQFNMKEMIKTISEENMTKPVFDNSYNVKTPEVKLSTILFQVIRKSYLCKNKEVDLLMQKIKRIWMK